MNVFWKYLSTPTLTTLWLIIDY